MKNSKESGKNEIQKRRKASKEISKGIEIVNNFNKKKKKQKENNLKKAKKTRNREKNITKRRIIIFLLVVITIVLLFYIGKYRHILGITWEKHTTHKDIIIVETTSSENKIYAYKNEVLVYSKGELATYNRYGKKTWEYKFDETFIPDIKTNGKYIQVVNKEKGDLYIFENKYEICREKIGGKINLFNINARGESVIHYSKAGSKSVIGVYKKRGDKKYEVTLANPNIAEVLLSYNGKDVIYYEIGTEGVSVNTIIKMVDLSTDSKIEEIINVSNDIIYSITLKKNNVSVLCSDKIYSYNFITKSNKEINVLDENVLNINMDKTGIAYISKENATNKNKIVIKNNNRKDCRKQ
ncbi:MAG: DUF5711 family protein [Clostridia bacterium]|nr:DUF5711 family protein [Clostridia bacterium]MDD4376109.1 DUF5711 family protein [Clostridia bacterium]